MKRQNGDVNHSSDIAHSLAVDHKGNIIVTGVSAGDSKKPEKKETTVIAANAEIL
ncbi:hypothetical protein [Niastella caeni]|uniref:hypothetical protein n=1 Tax=Niastella caeni TaxID=2569763 RepID=UPI00129B39A6|nr:hypothetical protein [Niastella caeni]